VVTIEIYVIATTTGARNLHSTLPDGEVAGTRGRRSCARRRTQVWQRG
jgi:hypothetical protein